MGMQSPVKSRQADLQHETGASQHWGCMRDKGGNHGGTQGGACATTSNPSADANGHAEGLAEGRDVEARLHAHVTAGARGQGPVEGGLASAEPLPPPAVQSDSSTKRSTSWQRVSGARHRCSPNTAPVVLADAEEDLLSS